jgi:hypothetical protein
LGNSKWTIAEIFPLALSHQEIRLKSMTIGNLPALYWEVSVIDKISEFQIEMSVNGQQFNWIETIKANQIKAMNTYLIRNQFQLRDRLFFRVRGIASDQTETYSNIIYIDFEEDIIIYPNPAKDHLLIRCREKELSAVRLLDANGSSKLMTTTDYGNTIGFNISHLPTGQYWLYLLKDGKWKIYPFVKR